MEEPQLTVGFVAKRCGVNVSTLHFYESKGLIRSWRNQGNQRRYKKEVLRRVSMIKAAQKLGVSLRDIKEAMDKLPSNRTPNKQDWKNLSALWHQQLDDHIKALTNLRDSLTGCIGCGCLSMTNCPIYNPQDVLSKEGSGPILLNIKN